MRRVIAAVGLLAVVSTPVVEHTRLFCRFTGIEITDCAEQDIPGTPVIQVEGCCDRQVTRVVGIALTGQQQEIAPPTLHALPAVSVVVLSGLAPRVQRAQSAAAPTGPPLLLITRALLI